MKKTIVFFALIAFAFSSCQGDGKEGSETETGVNKDALKVEIKAIEDSLFSVIPDVPKDLYDLAISRNLQYFDHFPEDEFSAECLDRVQGYFSQLQRLKLSILYTDTLLSRFPNYQNKQFLMYNRATTLDFIRDTVRAKIAYEEYLKTFPDLPKEEREEIEELIKLVPYSFEERILMMN
jgi:tetratricopeptide (TPR) repeat protein